MKSKWITVALCLVVAVILIVRLVPHGRPRRTGAPAAKQGHAANAFAGLRSLVLNGTRANFGLGPGASPTQPFAVVTDWGDAQGATTIIAVADGSASVYYSNGGGSIGGGQTHASIRDAALRTLEVAGAAQPLMRRTTEFPVAGRGEVSFYLVTDAGVFTATAAQDELSANRSPFSALATAANTIVTEYRQVDQK
jgi:hypothetical protein